MRYALVCGAGGFIGHHMVKRLKAEGYWVRGVDLVKPAYEPSPADEFIFADLRSSTGRWGRLVNFDEVYQFAANMGGMGFLGDAKNDAEVLRDNAMINLRVLDTCAAMARGLKEVKVFFASSACVYPEMQTLGFRSVHTTDGGYYSENRTGCLEKDAYPAHPDLEYGWEKLFSERLYASYSFRFGFPVRIGRFHNVYGPLGTWKGGREKAPAALCRKVAEAQDGAAIEIWGDGLQQRSFMYIDDAIEGVRRLMASDFNRPINIGSDEMVTVNQLARVVSDIAGKQTLLQNGLGPVGVRGRNSDNTLIKQTLGWAPSISLRDGLAQTYKWIEKQVNHEVSV